MSENSFDLIIKCLEITQPIGTFYLGVIDYTDLLDITFSDVRELSDQEVDKYFGIQRHLSADRVKELQWYVNTIDATFPTGIILSISSINAIYNSKTGMMKIRKAPEIAKIIDGQHRIAGLQGFIGKQFQLNVVIFIDMEIEDQAMVFAKINLAQTKVNKSLVYDLFEYTTKPSPQRTAHNCTRLLNSKEGSPFQSRIKILGTANPRLKAQQLLTQATFVESILILISGDLASAEQDREDIKRGKKLVAVKGTQESNLIFRNLFIESKEAEIAKIIWNYFSAIKNKWPDAWGSNEKGNILPRTNGFKAFMRLLPIVYLQIFYKNDEIIPSINDFSETIGLIDLVDSDFSTSNFKPGTEGESSLFKRISSPFI
jgi:DGQHR domain-containing protein